VEGRDVRFERYVREPELTYDQYCLVLDSTLDEGILSGLKDKALELAAKALGPIKKVVDEISRDLKVGIGKVVEAFKQRSVFEFLKAVRFNVGAILRALKALGSLVRDGLFKVFEELSKTGVVQKVRKGTMKVDEVLDRYPVLKRLAGVAVAGLLVYIWLNMTFIGDLDYDFNWADIVAALTGKFSFTDMFTSPSGLMLVALFATGPVISVPWLGKSAFNVTLALFYTGYTKLKDKDLAVVKKIRGMIR
jgi:hypothetical protein